MRVSIRTWQWTIDVSFSLRHGFATVSNDIWSTKHKSDRAKAFYFSLFLDTEPLPSKSYRAPNMTSFQTTQTSCLLTLMHALTISNAFPLFFLLSPTMHACDYFWALRTLTYIYRLGKYHPIWTFATSKKCCFAILTASFVSFSGTGVTEIVRSDSHSYPKSWYNISLVLHSLQLQILALAALYDLIMLFLMKKFWLDSWSGYDVLILNSLWRSLSCWQSTMIWKTPRF